MDIIDEYLEASQTFNTLTAARRWMPSPGDCPTDADMIKLASDRDTLDDLIDQAFIKVHKLEGKILDGIRQGSIRCESS